MTTFFDLEKLAIIVVALFMAYAEFAQAMKYRKRWIKYGLGIMGMYWAGYYGYSILRAYFDWAFAEHQIFVRSGILLTLSLVASGAWITLQELRKFE